jgi:hypothetical protein
VADVRRLSIQAYSSHALIKEPEKAKAAQCIRRLISRRLRFGTFSFRASAIARHTFRDIVRRKPSPYVTSTQNQAVQVQYQAKKNVSISALRDEYGGYAIDVRIHKRF